MTPEAVKKFHASDIKPLQIKNGCLKQEQLSKTKIAV
jgi:hypothetical protein